MRDSRSGPADEWSEGPLERLWWESDVRLKLTLAKDVGVHIARQSPEVTADEMDAYRRGYEKAIDVLSRMLLGSSADT